MLVFSVVKDVKSSCDAQVQLLTGNAITSETHLFRFANPLHLVVNSQTSYAICFQIGTHSKQKGEFQHMARQPGTDAPALLLQHLYRECHTHLMLVFHN